MEVISCSRMSNQSRILLEDHRTAAECCCVCVCVGKKMKKAREIQKYMQRERERKKESENDIPNYPSCLAKPCWPTKQTLGPSAPAKSLSYLPNIYKIPANNPFITLCLCSSVYLPPLLAPSLHLHLWQVDGELFTLFCILPQISSSWLFV